MFPFFFIFCVLAGLPLKQLGLGRLDPEKIQCTLPVISHIFSSQLVRNGKLMNANPICLLGQWSGMVCFYPTIIILGHLVTDFLTGTWLPFNHWPFSQPMGIITAWPPFTYLLVTGAYCYGQNLAGMWKSTTEPSLKMAFFYFSTFFVSCSSCSAGALVGKKIRSNVANGKHEPTKQL